MKRWRYGMNKSDEPQKGDTLYIAHDLENAEQYGKVIEALAAYGLNPLPVEYNPSECITITL